MEARSTLRSNRRTTLGWQTCLLTLGLFTVSLFLAAASHARPAKFTLIEVSINGQPIVDDPQLRSLEFFNGCNYSGIGPSPACTGTVQNSWKVLVNGGFQQKGSRPNCSELWIINSDPSDSFYGSAYFGPVELGWLIEATIKGKVDPKEMTDALIDLDLRDCPDSHDCHPTPIYMRSMKRCVAPRFLCAWQHERPEKGRVCAKPNGEFTYKGRHVVTAAEAGKFITVVFRFCRGCRQP